MIDIRERGVRNRDSIHRIDRIKRLFTGGDQFLVGLDDHDFVVDHPIVFFVVREIEILEETGATRGAIDRTENRFHIRFDGGFRQVTLTQHLRIPGEGVKIAEISGCPGVGLRGAGHHIADLTGACGAQNIGDMYRLPDPTQFLSTGFFDAEDDRGTGNTLAIVGVDVLTGIA